MTVNKLRCRVTVVRRWRFDCFAAVYCTSVSAQMHNDVAAALNRPSAVLMKLQCKQHSCNLRWSEQPELHLWSQTQKVQLIMCMGVNTKHRQP